MKKEKSDEKTKRRSVMIYITQEQCQYIDEILSRELFGIEKKRSAAISWLIEHQRRNEKNRVDT